MMKKKFCISLLLLFVIIPIKAQEVAVKTNALYWAMGGTPNLGLEFKLNDRFSLGIDGGYNFWTLNKEANRKMKHFKVMPELRYWLNQPYHGAFFGLHSGYTQYNLSAIPLLWNVGDTKKHRYQGWATGAGISYGYSWILGRRWNLEASIGFGYVYANFDKYDCAKCGEHEGNLHKHYFGPTQAAVSIIYLIK